VPSADPDSRLRVVTLTTDFGTRDGYVGQMKGVLISQAPGVALVDITHDIPPQDVEAARRVVEGIWRRFPPGTVHLVVVDPGVGSGRAALAVASEGRWLVGPDNGVLSPALEHPAARVVSLPVPRDASATFHGRDVFAPAAARLATGSPLDSLGPPWPSPVLLRAPDPSALDGGGVAGEVVHLDRFGNAVTNIAAPLGTHEAVVVASGAEIPLVRAYADVERHQPLALIGSGGYLEIAVRDGSAADRLGLRRGAPVKVIPRSPRGGEAR
jgi:S-adenosylmethionine hydrolase